MKHKNNKRNESRVALKNGTSKSIKPSAELRNLWLDRRISLSAASIQ